MIDEKKIEDAAIKHTFKEYERLFDHVDDVMINEVSETSFKAGISWFLDNLFHPSDETPKVGKEYLLKATFFNDEGYSFDAYVTSTFGIDGWKEDFFPRGYDLEVKEWACIDDLLKGGK